ncbi:DUF2017 domain-containing protein [Georgenia satyanarayanai]|uniref:DUF2017 domain-containing protein n=1 Tax=Georgenia satyanarayanai TaxID=860221 RepID=UPI00203E51A1|nr:DUF2017 domain-containing protein [Georgenia satyanarayanai]MCM3660938.1 DUF2017 domain-containing protein [Georgenia satyanarayanai]
MRAFTAVPGGYACELEHAELRIIARVTADTCELLGLPLDADDDAPDDHGSPAPSAEEEILASLDWDPAAGQTPRDPALARLLPPASTDDDELAAEMRRLTEGSLRATKTEQLRVVHDALVASTGLVVVRAGQERAWLSALTDLRLVLASRLGIETDEDAERVYERAGGGEPQTPADELDAALTSLYAALTWWQESLLEAMSGGPS